MEKPAEIIHQWQFLGAPDPALLKDEVLENAKKLGITSLESYFFWSEIEKEEGKIDFSSYDVLVEKLRKHNLKWVPFLILGPDYGTPEWFKKSKESVFYKCLEHQKESGNQSLWNPNLPKYVDRFLAEVAKHYDKDVLESILLGISGNWGEAIYPASGFLVGDTHYHSGFWCADKHAVQEYRRLKNKDFPALEANKPEGLVSFLVKIISKMPRPIRKSLKLILKFRKRKFYFVQGGESQPKNIGTPADKQNWLDFINWYLGSMTNWVDLWLKTARKYFPETKIYFTTGGTGNPVLGADFVNQVKAAKKYGAGVRITNQTDDYAQSFILARLVSSACRFYGTYFTTEEEAILHTENGVTMRIFDAISSGADGFYCKNIIAQGWLYAIEGKIPVGQSTPGAKSLEKYINLLEVQRPIIKTAVFFPNTSIAFNPGLISDLFNRCADLRDALDFDLVDETMIKDGALEKYDNLLVLAGELPKGGIPSSIKVFYDPEEIKDEIDGEYDGVYATRFPDKILYYNSTASKKIKKVNNKMIEVNPHSIISINI